MSDSSDVEIVSVSGNLNNISNKSTDDIEFSNSSDDYDDDPRITGMKAIKQAKSELVKDQRSHLTKLFDFLKEVVLNGQVSRESWKRTTIVCKALKACQDLVLEEDKLKLELEILLQENWRLKKKIGRMSNRRKRKSGCNTLTRKVSSLSLCSPKLTVPEKKIVPMDDSPAEVKPTPEVPETVLPKPGEQCEEIPPKSEVNPRQLRRRFKKRAGLSEEEKEFHMLKEKIEDILYEVDSLWNEVKDEDEQENKDFKGDLTPESVKLESFLCSETIDNSTSSPESSQTTSSLLPMNVAEKRSLISVADISKLLAPQFVHKELKDSTTEISKSKFGFTSNVDDSSDDESPRLVIDEGDSPKNSDHEVETFEAFQEVGEIRKNCIGDKGNNSNKNDNAPLQKETEENRKSRVSNNSDGSQSDSSVIVIE